MKHILLILLLPLFAQAQSVIFTPNTENACTAACKVAFAPPAPVITLSNVPDGLTTNRLASITYTVTPAGTPVWCRRDIYTPIVCPNPFILGAGAPLATGMHRVDYYAGASTPDTSKPLISYSWVISAVPPPPPASSPPPTAGALASLPYPVGVTFSGTGVGSVTTTSTVTGSDGIVRLQQVDDPGGSGQKVYLHRIVRKDGQPNGTSLGTTVRAEKLWIDQNRYMKPGNDYWLAFAVRPKGGEWPAQQAGLTDDGFLVFQTHSESNGDTQPPIQLNVDTGQGQLKWRTSYGTAAQATGPSGTATPNAQPLPAVDVWRKYVVHLKPGWLASQGPLTEVWESVGSGPFVKLFSSTAPNDYNWNTGSYARIGLYKWANWQTSVPTIACYLTTLYMESGANKYDAAVASVSAFK